MSEGYNYPKKPESEIRHNEFVRTAKEIAALRLALKQVRTPTFPEEDAVYVEPDSPSNEHAPTSANRVALELKLKDQVERYEKLRDILGEEASS